jgi:hypothetical protein
MRKRCRIAVAPEGLVSRSSSILGGQNRTVTRVSDRTRVACLCLGLALAGPITSFSQERRSMSPRHATGTFSVRMLPRPEAPSRFVRLQLDKTFEGALVGTSEVEMLASDDGTTGSGGYVALERVTGTLDGRRGTFILQHSGTMSPGSMHIDVRVSPGSGTGALTGLAGMFTIRIEGKKHFYDFLYTLPQ